MKVRALINYQDENRRVHLVGDRLDIKSSEFDPVLHSEEVAPRRKTTNNKKASNV